jgi:LytS/YehU family sensor histidine kinase
METRFFAERSLAAELESIETFLEKETSRHQGNLSWSCSVDDKVDTGIVIPESLIGIFVENAISGELIWNGKAGRIEISAHTTSLGLLIMINDQDIRFKDFSRAKQQREVRLRKLNHYLETFNGKHAYRIHYDILDRSIHDTEKTGSRILITIQYQ